MSGQALAVGASTGAEAGEAVSSPGLRAFGLSEPEVRRLAGSIAPQGTDGAGWAERFARAAWTTLAEPGDAAAGALIAALGSAAAALELVIEQAGRPADRPRRGRRAADAGEALPGFAEPLPPGLSGAEIGDLDPAALRAGLARWTPRLSARAVVRSIEQASRLGIRCAMPGDPGWPGQLADLGPCAPLAMWLRGDPARVALMRRSAAIVGARACTRYGEHMAVELAVGLGDRRIAVVSGGAVGIDAAAHRAALASDALTVAVLAGGLDRPYPAEHDRLFARIASDGLLLSEVPCGVPPTRWRFLNRNRVIAALTGATVVVEAGRRSGTLNTAGHAAALGRPLGAVPGPVTSASSAGCHRLLREYDATCVTGVVDALELLGLADPLAGEEEAPHRLSAMQTRILDSLALRAPRTAGEVARLAGLSVAEALAGLGTLQLLGAVRAADDGRWVRLRVP